ncbi:MAG: hypothetical protein V1837_01985 [Candidatus Woesearchaeota archaeon]
MPLKDIFRPTKEKIITDLILAILFVSILLLVPYFGLQRSFNVVGLNQKAEGAILSLIFSFIVYYPLACSVVFIYKWITRQKIKYTKTDFIVATVIILLWNPFGLGYAYSLATRAQNKVLNEQCGAIVTGFADISSAREAGISVGETINEADETNIVNTASLLQVLTNKQPGDSISIKTNIREYEIPLRLDTQSQKPVLGIKVKDAYCRK